MFSGWSLLDNVEDRTSLEKLPYRDEPIIPSFFRASRINRNWPTPRQEDSAHVRSHCLESSWRLVDGRLEKR